MSGSKRDFSYEFDSGIVAAIQADESNTEAVNGAAAASSTTGLIILPIAKYVRRVRYSSVDKLHSAIVPVLTPEGLENLPVSIEINKANGSGGAVTVTLFLKKKYAERFATSTGQDSGLNDGDTP
jgi:hypothetical protein